MAAQSYDAAEASFLNAQTLDTSDFRWPYYLGHLYRMQGQLEKAQAAVRARPPAAARRHGDAGLAGRHRSVVGAARCRRSRGSPRRCRSTRNRCRPDTAWGGRRSPENDPRRAVTYLEEVLELNPNAGDAHYPLSLAYSALGDSAKAGEHLRLRRSQQILPADPLMAELDELLREPADLRDARHPGARSRRLAGGGGRVSQGARAGADEPGPPLPAGDDDEHDGGCRSGAEKLFEEVVHDNPEYFPAQFSLGRGAAGEGAVTPRPSTRFSAALKERSDYAEARLRLASSLRRLGRTKEALSHYEQVANANPDLTRGAHRLRDDAGAARALTDARDYLAGQVKAHPDQLIFTHGLARLLAAAPDDRVRDGGQAMALVQGMLAKGRTLELGETMAMTLAALGQYDEAAEVQRDLMRTAERLGLASRQTAAGAQPSAVRAAPAMRDAVDQRGNAMKPARCRVRAADRWRRRSRRRRSRRSRRSSSAASSPDPSGQTITVTGANFGARPFVTLDLAAGAGAVRRRFTAGRVGAGEPDAAGHLSADREPRPGRDRQRIAADSPSPAARAAGARQPPGERGKVQDGDAVAGPAEPAARVGDQSITDRRGGPRMGAHRSGRIPDARPVVFTKGGAASPAR